MTKLLPLGILALALGTTPALAQVPYNNYQYIRLPNGCLAIVHNWGYWSGGGMPAPTYSFPQYPQYQPQYPYAYGYGYPQPTYPYSPWQYGRRW